MRAFVGATCVVLLAIAAIACGDDGTTTGSGGAGGQSATGGSGQGGGGQDGDPCTTESDCLGGYICVYDDGTCGASDTTRRCTQYPASCGEGPLRTYCDCDGASHGAACVLEADTRANACAPPMGQFYCGEALCTLGTEYCGGETALTCTALPAACQAAGADCSCFEPLNGPCGCTQLADGHFEIGCSTI